MSFSFLLCFTLPILPFFWGFFFVFVEHCLLFASTGRCVVFACSSANPLLFAEITADVAEILRQMSKQPMVEAEALEDVPRLKTLFDVLLMCLAVFGWFLVGFWLVLVGFGWFLVGWLVGWFLVGFWLVFGWLLVGFGWILVGWLVGFGWLVLVGWFWLVGFGWLVLVGWFWLVGFGWLVLVGWFWLVGWLVFGHCCVFVFGFLFCVGILCLLMFCFIVFLGFFVDACFLLRICHVCREHERC